MDKMNVNVKMADLNLRASDSTKSGSQTKEASDDFKKLLKDQTDEGGNVSKDTKTDKKPEQTETSKDETKPVKDEKTQTESLLAAYQMDLGMRPEMIQAEQPTEEVVMPEVGLPAEEVTVQAADISLTAEEVMPEQIQTEAAQPTGQMPEEQTEGTMAVTFQETVRQTETVAENTPETAVVQKRSEETGEETAQTDTRAAEQAVQPQMTEPVAEAKEVLPEEPVRMQVPQPEALPEKLADQIMTKVSDGVQEFEIQIEPENLGKIAVKILYHEGETTVSILCSEKRTLEMLGRSAGELGQVIEKNLGGTTTIIVDKQESDYLNQTRDENGQNGREDGQEQKQNKKDQNAEDAEQFLQKLRLGLAG